MIAARPEIELKIERWLDALTTFEPLSNWSDQKECQRHALPQIDVLARIFEEMAKRAKIKVKERNRGRAHIVDRVRGGTLAVTRRLHQMIREIFDHWVN